MKPIGLKNAAQLAARVPADEALSPKAIELGDAWLDLRGQNSLVLLARADDVAMALGPCLGLQDDARLVVSVDGLHAKAVAITMSATLQRGGLPDLPIAVLRGEDVLAGLEEFLVAGCPLRNEQPPHEALSEETRRPLVAVAEAPPSALRDAFEAGARIVVSQSADRETVEAAFGEAPKHEQPGAVTLWFPETLKAQVAFNDPRPLDELRRLLQDSLPPEASVVLSEAGDQKLLGLAAHYQDHFYEACRRCGLLLDGLPTRLDNVGSSVYDKRTTRVPADLLEFGWDLRTAREWMGG